MNMTYEEFLECCFKADNVLIVEDGTHFAVSGGYLENIEKDLFIEVDWVSGGINGNSCFGRNNTSVNPQMPKSIEEPISEIFFALSYDMSFVTYNRKIRPLIESFEKNEHPDYYGNCYLYSGLRIKLKDIYNTLNEIS
jgi:hypothetical protein